MHFLTTNVRVIAAASIVVGIICVAAALLPPRRYEATVAFTPSGGTRTNLGTMSGLAAQLGLQLDAGGDNLAFYAALVKSRELLTRLMTERYTTRSADGRTVTSDLASLLEIDASNEPDRRRKLFERLERMIAVRMQSQANIIEVKVTSPRPELSEQLAQGVLEKVNAFNMERRRIQAAAEREFTEERVGAETRRLELLEVALADFSRRNRSYANSPELSLERNRLQRRVDLQQQVLTSLLQSLERARIEEVRNTPLVTPIDLPAGSATVKPRGILLSALLGVFFGAFLGVVIALARDNLVKAGETDPTRYADLAALARKPWTIGRRPPRPEETTVMLSTSATRTSSSAD